MNPIISVQASNGMCTITTTAGRFDRWPGRTIDGMQWWGYTPAEGGRPAVVTVPETVAALDDLHAQASPTVRHLRLVKGAA